MKTPVLHGVEDPDVREGFPHGASHGGVNHCIAPGQPLLQDAPGPKPLLHSRIELSRIEEAGTRGFHGRWGIQSDDIVLLRGAFQIAPAIVNHYSR